MVNSLFIKKAQELQNAVVDLPSSKSESNRGLIIQALAQKQKEANVILHNLSKANDTQVLHRLLKSQDPTLDVEDAGTTMRFLTAFLAFSGQEKILTGTDRMKERPIKVLVDALNNLGANIHYLGKVGFPPLHILPTTQNNKYQITIAGNISSQYISALLMLAPTLENGLELTLKTEVKSKPYIQMTLDLMEYFGIQYIWKKNIIKIAKQTYQANTYTIQADWSASSYFYSLVGIDKNIKVLLKNLQENTLQGDKKIVELARFLGVESKFSELGVELYFNPTLLTESLPILDFSDCPDLAQTMIVWASAAKISVWLKGMESLKIKETNRILALQKELVKFNILLEEKEQGLYFLDTEKASFSQTPIAIQTYQDHRMAMAFMTLALKNPLKIEAPHVVSKSYPNFWENIKNMGFEV